MEVVLVVVEVEFPVGKTVVVVVVTLDIIGSVSSMLIVVRLGANCSIGLVCGCSFGCCDLVGGRL